jgi:tight adherence protein C
MNLADLLPIAVFLVIVCGTWAVLSALADRETDVSRRVRRLLGAAHGKPTSQLDSIRKQARIQALVARAAPALAKPLEGKAEEIGKLRVELLHAGFRSQSAVQVYLAIKFVLLLLALAVMVPIAYSRHGFTNSALIEIGLAAGAAFYVPTIGLALLKRKRQEKLFLGLPDALDLMVVCVEAGLGLDSAMRKVAAELVGSCRELCEELAISNFQVQMGRPRREVLHDLGTRTGVADIRALAAILIQAERFGSSIATALRVQSDSMRSRRRQLAEERAAKTAVQMIFPLVLFVVLVGPAGIQIATMLNAR